MNLSTLLESACHRFGDKTFVLFERQAVAYQRHLDPSVFRQQLTYREFNCRVDQACGYLADLGLKPGDVFNIHLPNCISFLILWFASARMGAVMMPTNILSSVDEMQFLLGHSASRISFTTRQQLDSIASCADGLETLERIICCDPYSHNPDSDCFEAEYLRFAETPYPSTVESSDLAAILYTSGTTSKPKGVMVTHANYIKAGQTVADAICLNKDDRHFVVLPLFHGNAQYYSTMSALITGASIALMDRFSASQYFDKCIEYQSTVASLFAAPMRMILAQPTEPRHRKNGLKVIIYAQNITPDQIQQWEYRFGPHLSQLWGMTETMGPPLMNGLDSERRNWTIGKPVGGYSVRLVDINGNDVAVGEQGEIVVQGVAGETIMAGYFNNNSATRETIRDGWLYTGDNAVQDDQGFFRFVDRIKDMIKRSGENVSAGEVESVLLQHPAVFECAVVGLPDDFRDEKIVGVVVLAGGCSIGEVELIQFCQQKLASFRVPETIVFTETLPKTSVGKIQKHLIRADLAPKSRPG